MATPRANHNEELRRSINLQRMRAAENLASRNHVRRTSRMIPTSIRDHFQEVLNEVSDEVGQETKGRYLLKYEGWSPNCFPPYLKHDEAMYNYAARQTPKIVKEWQRDLPGYILLESGYQEESGLYGVTYAIFRTR